MLATLAHVTAYRLRVFFYHHTSHQEIYCAVEDKAVVGSYSDECKNEKTNKKKKRKDNEEEKKREDGLEKEVMKMYRKIQIKTR